MKFSKFGLFNLTMYRCSEFIFRFFYFDFSRLIYCGLEHSQTKDISNNHSLSYTFINCITSIKVIYALGIVVQQNIKF